MDALRSGERISPVRDESDEEFGFDDATQAAIESDDGMLNFQCSHRATYQLHTLLNGFPQASRRLSDKENFHT